MIAAAFGASDGALLGAVAVLLFFSAVLALAETGLVRTSRSRARALVEQGRAGAHSLAKLVEDPEGFLGPVLLLVLICQLVAATLVGVVASRLFGPLGVAVATVFEVVVVFVVAEAVPKHWAVRHADRAALFTAPMVAAVIAFPPVRALASVLIGLSRFVTPGGDDDDQQAEVTESELLALADVAVEADVLEEEERELLSAIVEFGDTIVREVMVPRPDVVAVESEASVGAALEVSIGAGLSRLPVYRGAKDDIVGIAYTRDLFAAARAGRESAPVGEVQREARYVPETKRVAPLMREMQQGKFHIAVVVDEYGGTAGIVTLEDLIEELVGEISDEFDAAEPDVQIISENELRVSGRTPIDEVNELARTKLPDGDWDTVAGLLLHLAGQPLVEGETVETAGARLVAERVQGRRIRTVRVVRLEPADSAAERR